MTRPIRTGAVERCLWSEDERSGPPEPVPLPHRVDVAVVGGGYTGLSAARALGRHGARVAVLERHRVGWGASGRNGGFVLPGFQVGLAELVERVGATRAGRMFEWSVEAIRGLEALIAAEAIECGYVRCGSIQLATRPGHLAGLERERQCLRQVAGHDTLVLGTAELEAEIGSPSFAGGLLDLRAGALHPGRYVRGLAAAATRAGAELHEGAGVMGIDRVSQGFELRTDRGPLRAREVLVATEGHTGSPFDWLRRRIVPVGSYLVATATLDPMLAVRLVPRGRVLYDTRRLLRYFRLSPDGRMLFGGRVAMTPRGTGKAARTLGRAMREVFPALATAPIDFAWSGTVGFSRDRMPHAGRLDGVYYALGYGGHGVALATWLGERMGNAMLGGERVPDLGPLPRVPLYGGRPWFLPLVDAYYRLRDRLG